MKLSFNIKSKMEFYSKLTNENISQILHLRGKPVLQNDKLKKPRPRNEHIRDPEIKQCG